MSIAIVSETTAPRWNMAEASRKTIRHTLEAIVLDNKDDDRVPTNPNTLRLRLRYLERGRMPPKRVPQFMSFDRNTRMRNNVCVESIHDSENVCNIDAEAVPLRSNVSMFLPPTRCSPSTGTELEQWLI